MPTTCYQVEFMSIIYILLAFLASNLCALCPCCMYWYMYMYIEILRYNYALTFIYTRKTTANSNIIANGIVLD